MDKNIPVTLVSNEKFKEMSQAERDELISSFKRECLLASDDVQGVLDFTAEVIALAKKCPLKLDYTRLVNAINGEIPSDPTKLERTEIAGENNG